MSTILIPVCVRYKASVNVGTNQRRTAIVFRDTMDLGNVHVVPRGAE